METIVVKAKSKKQAEDVVKKLKKIQCLQIQTTKTWLELDRSLPNVEMSEDEIMKEARAVRYGKRAQVKNNFRLQSVYQRIHQQKIQKSYFQSY
jgi:hypothetical protein